MFGVGTTELLIILLVIFLLFGARRLPELGKGLGEGMRSFRDALKAPDQPPAPPTAPTTTTTTTAQTPAATDPAKKA
jgi:sec-independent protein translocase protein TatA